MDAEKSTGDVALTVLNAPPQKIAIIGAGFTGVALAAALHRSADQPLEIFMFEKSGLFGAGDAYRTPYSWHLLNARACDMSAIEDDPDHFVHWLESHAATYLDNHIPHGRQFVPRVLYHQYLCSLMAAIFQDECKRVHLELIPEEVMDVEAESCGVKVTLKNEESLIVDKVIFAYGNNPPAPLPISLSPAIQCFNNPWEYTALKNIPNKDPVLIVGTGLSMVDAVLTLHHLHHQGKIYVLSRRGMLPLPHTDNSHACAFDALALPHNLRAMVKVIRHDAKKLMAQGGDWRAIIHQIRLHLPAIWRRMNTTCKKRFLRHVLPYWNSHRHRVHEKIDDLLVKLRNEGQLIVMAGKLISTDNQQATIRLRHALTTHDINVKQVINCIGSSHDINEREQPLLGVLKQRGNIDLDELQLGLIANEDFSLKNAAGDVLPGCYALGPPLRGEVWESVAVPEIRKQCHVLAALLLSESKQSHAAQQFPQTKHRK